MAEEKKNAKPAATAKNTNAVKKEDKKLGFFQRIGKWFRDMKAELKKVIWPTKKQVLNNTLVALAVMLVAAVFIWGFDQIAQMGVKALITLVK